MYICVLFTIKLFKMKKAILIDANNREIKEVSLGDDYKEIYQHIGCEIFDVVRIDENNDVYVDDEGLLKLSPESKFFFVEGYPQPLAGNGLVTGIDNNTGETISTSLTVEQLKSKVKFMNMFDVQEYARNTLY